MTPRGSASAAPPIRIVIADDHPIVRGGLRNIVEAESDLVIVGEASTADELRRTALEVCDVLVLDLSMPGAIGLGLLKEIRTRFPSMPILVLSISPEEQFAIRALRAGASGYVTKRSAPAMLVDAVRRVFAGGVYVSVAVSRQLAAQALRPAVRAGSKHSRLSDRELEILQLLVSGLSSTKIAAHLHISVKTVSTHRARLLAKLGLDSNAALVRFAIRERLAEA